jgi:fructokinase
MPAASAHKAVCFGEILWDILPHSSVPGGAPMNVAHHLQKLGKNPALITRVGFDDMGERLVNICSGYGICTDYFQIDYKVPTGKVYAEFKEQNEVSYNIVKPVAWDFIRWEDDFVPLLQNSEYLVFGSLITRNKQSRNTLCKCLEIAKTKVLDINMRHTDYNKKIIEELLRKADILKMNLAELHLITGWFSDYTSDNDRIQLLKDKFNIESVIVTMGSEGAILNLGTVFYRHPGYMVEVADTVGAGDAFLAGVISKLIDRAPPQEVLEFASKLGAFIASQKGACPTYTLSAINGIHSLGN